VDSPVISIWLYTYIVDTSFPITRIHRVYIICTLMWNKKAEIYNYDFFK